MAVNPGAGPSSPAFIGGAIPLTLRRTTATSLTSTGTNQATGRVLTAQLNVATSCPAGTCFVLPTTAQAPGGVLGEIHLIDKDSNAATVYPPVGGQIDTYGINQPVSVPNYQLFIPDATNPLQWWALT